MKKPSSTPAMAMRAQKMGCAWGRLCLLLSLLLQLPGSQAKCYFQAKGKQGGEPGRCQWEEEASAFPGVAGLCHVCLRSAEGTALSSGARSWASDEWKEQSINHRTAPQGSG